VSFLLVHAAPPARRAARPRAALLRRFMAVNVAFNNLSLVSLSLSLNQVIR